MEDLNQPLDAGTGAAAAGPRLRFTEPVRSDLLETSKWAMFFAVLLFIFLGIMTLFALMAIFSQGMMGFVAAIFIIGIYGAILFFPAWYYYKFSMLTRQALTYSDTEILDEGFVYLKRFYRFVGILIIVLISLYLLLAIIGLSMFMSNDLFHNLE
ncbi:MAG TPA: hypothetical protein PK228_18795 [Saprospiraceae bacterium]|nr:hypothetical protein [Saprospiraceae bacterium]